MYKLNRALALAAAAALAASPVTAADNIPVKGADGNTYQSRAKDLGGGVQMPIHGLADFSGAAFGTSGNPIYFQFPSTPTINLGTLNGAASAANQATANASLASILSQLQSTLTVGGNTIVARCTSDPSPCFTTTSAGGARGAGTVIADTTVAGSVTIPTFQVCRVNGGKAWLTRIRFRVASDTGFAGQSVILKVYRDSPTLTNGDRGSWSTNYASLIKSVSITLDPAYHTNDYEGGVSEEMRVAFDCAAGSKNIYILPITSSAFTDQAGSKAIYMTVEGSAD